MKLYVSSKSLKYPERWITDNPFREKIILTPNETFVASFIFCKIRWINWWSNQVHNSWRIVRPIGVPMIWWVTKILRCEKCNNWLWMCGWFQIWSDSKQNSDFGERSKGAGFFRLIFFSTAMEIYRGWGTTFRVCHLVVGWHTLVCKIWFWNELDCNIWSWVKTH